MFDGAEREKVPAWTLGLPGDLHRLIDSSIAMISNEVRHHARLVKDYGAVPRVDAPEARLGQVFLNLVQNAAHAIPGGHADHNVIAIITGTTDEGDAFVEVHDTGAGVAPEQMERLFEAFYTTKPAGMGTGLGLSICHKIVTGLGGRIEASSCLGVGSIFRVTLPAARGVVTAPVAVIRAPTASTRRRRILVIDDEIEVGLSVKRILGKQHDVEVVTGGHAALAAIAARGFDVVLCDLMMPEMSGMELYEQLRATRPELIARVAFMSGGTFSPDGREFLSRVTNPQLDKPFDADRLRALLERMSE